MSLPDSREPGSAIPIYIVQHGSNHGSLNIQGPERVKGVVADVFGKTLGKKIVYGESFGGTDEESSRNRRLIRAKGLMFYAAARMVGSVDEGKVRPRMFAFSAPDQQLVDRRVIDWNNAHQFFTLKRLQEMRDGGLDFDYVLEGHRQQSLRKLSAQQASLNGGLKAGVAKWYSGDFDAGVEANKYWFRDRLKFQNTREPEIHTQIGDLVAEIQRDPNGGALFINAGFTHGSFIDRLRESRFKPTFSPVFEEHLAVPVNTPELVIDQALRRGEAVDDVLYARDMLLKRGLEQLGNDAARGGKLYVFGQNFETITQVIVDVVNGLSVANIRKHCEQKQAFSAFLSQFPSGGFVLSTIQ